VFDNSSDMRVRASVLLRNFPAICRAGLAGERIVIETREGNLVRTAEKPQPSALFGSLSSAIDSRDLSEKDSGADSLDWLA
jgi:hypothetical protein